MILLLGLLCAGPAQAWRCGTQLVTEGDSRYAVQQACGKPDYAERYPAGHSSGFGPIGAVRVWYYNGGPGSLVRILRFREGELDSIETGGRGFSSYSQGDCSPQDINEGLGKYRLIKRCGEPVFQDGWWEYRSGYGIRRVEQWIYDFGYGQFTREVELVNGRVREIELGDR